MNEIEKTKYYVLHPEVLSSHFSRQYIILIHDVNPSQLGEAQWCISPIYRSGCEKHYLMRARPSSASRYKVFANFQNDLIQGTEDMTE